MANFQNFSLSPGQSDDVTLNGRPYLILRVEFS